MLIFFFSSDSCGPFHKHFTVVTYGRSKISCTVLCMHAPVQHFQKALAYFAMDGREGSFTLATLVGNNANDSNT